MVKVRIGNTYMVHCKGPEMKRSVLLGSGGRTTSKRIHALMFTVNDEVQQQAMADQLEQLTEDNPGWTFKYVKVG